MLSSFSVFVFVVILCLLMIVYLCFCVDFTFEYIQREGLRDPIVFEIADGLGLQ